MLLILLAGLYMSEGGLPVGTGDLVGVCDLSRAEVEVGGDDSSLGDCSINIHHLATMTAL